MPPLHLPPPGHGLHLPLPQGSSIHTATPSPPPPAPSAPPATAPPTPTAATPLAPPATAPSAESASATDAIELAAAEGRSEQHNIQGVQHSMHEVEQSAVPNGEKSVQQDLRQGALQQAARRESDSDSMVTGEASADVHVDASQRTLRSHAKRPLPSSDSTTPSPTQKTKSQKKRDKRRNKSRNIGRLEKEL